MKSTFHDKGNGVATIQNTTSVGNEHLNITLHPGQAFSIDIQVEEDTNGQNTISIDQDGLTKLCEWFRNNGYTT